MSCVPLSPSSYEMGPRDYLNRFVSLISSLRGGQSRYLPLLQSKISEVLPSYQLPHHPSLSSSSRIDVYPHHHSAGSSNAASNEESSYEAPPNLGMRQNMPMHYAESKHSSIAGASAGYPSFSAAMSYHEPSTSGATMGGHGVYQTHIPDRASFSHQYADDTKDSHV